ncbi:Leucine-rich repeat-containing protein 71 [Liparis tanakae]|uniref:Leucine-rich repeat-containing protein 71 n=1 Tax=Liparis tanakae TaxID=230148 RepID=A0A4Z2FR12_9TELE|nr:Leucine-rich repeat-containing protein 71 [Liparis tanakae]
MSRERRKERADKAHAEDEASKSADEYQCSGDVEADFPALCALLDVKDIPTVITRRPASPTTDTEGDPEDSSESKSNAATPWSTPCLQVELENEDPLSAKKLKISGWKVDEQIARVIQKMFPSLSKLQSLQCWQAGLTDRMVVSLMDTVSLCSNLRAVTLEGNHLPERSYHLLLSEDSVLTHLSLRNNRMGDEGARLIGSALSTTKSANKNLLSLNLAFNSIGDAGARHIAQGLRYNRGLLVLSLGNNHIGDSGAAHLSAETSKKDEKPAATKENPKSKKKSSDIKTQSKSGKHGGQEKPQNAPEVPESRFLKRFKDRSSPALTEPGESVEILNPLLDQPVQYRDGELFLPGNETLASLDLAGNRITKKSLPLFLTSLEMQAEGGGLLRLCLQRNRFPPDCEYNVKITELMTLRDPLKKKSF